MRTMIVKCLLATIAIAATAHAQTTPTSAPWFGLTLPSRLGAESAVIVGERPARPIDARASKDPELQAQTIRKDLEAIVAFSKQSRSEKEIGSGQLWGRVSGLPSSAKTIDWAISELKRAGIADVKTQVIQQEARSALWLPLAWEVRLLGDAAFGPDSRDIVLESAMPLPPSDIANGELTAPLVYVGTGNPSLIDHFDVKGKIAVQLTVPQGHMVFERSVVTSRAQELMKHGAVAVLNLVRLPGNEHAFDFSRCGGPCFNIGGRDGWFLESVLDRAAQLGLQDKVRARLSLRAETRTGLQAQNGVAVIPGKKSDEVIVIDSHADAWFDGAGDNADGLAVTLAVARHFAKPANRLDRTLVFNISAGHHTAGINGPRAFVAANPDLAKKTVLVVNVEHVAQRNFSAARSTSADGYRQSVADSGEAPITFGVTNSAPRLNQIARQGVERFGVNLVSETSAMQSGETGGFADIKAAKITIMQAPPLYHTSGETLEVISTPGLERMARFLTFLIEQSARARLNELNP